MQNELVLALDSDRVARVKGHIAAIISELAGMVELDGAERVAANAVKEARLPFTIAGAKCSEQHGDAISIAPALRTSLAAATRDFNAMRDILSLVKSLAEAIDDTSLYLGSICFDKCLIVRNLVAVAIRSGVPGMDTVYNDLSYLWERSGKGKGSAPKNGGSSGNPTDGGGNAPA